MPKLTWEIPIRTVSELNCREHWTKKHRRHKQQKFFVAAALKKDIAKVKLPCKVTLTRLSGRNLDFDNLVCSMKWISDACADLLAPGLMPGMADADPRIKIDYAQEKQRKIGIRIEIQYGDS